MGVPCWPHVASLSTMQRTNSPRRRRLMYQRLASARSRHFERRTERMSIWMRRSAWIPVRLLVALLLRCRHHGRRTDQCRMGHRLLQSLTDGLGWNRETLKLFICRPSSRFRVLGPSSGWIPPSCNGPTTRSSATSLVDVVWRMSWPTYVWAYSFRPNCAWLQSSTGRASGTHATIEGSGVSERRLSSWCRFAWARPIVLCCAAWSHTRMVSMWSSSRVVCARRAARSLLTTKSHTTTIVRRRLTLLRHLLGRMPELRSFSFQGARAEFRVHLFTLPNRFTSTVFSLSILLGTRYWKLHLWNLPDSYKWNAPI